MKKIFVILLCSFSLLTSNLIAQESSTANAPTTTDETVATSTAPKGIFGSTFSKPTSFKEFLTQVSPFITIGPILTVNTESGTKSAVSPIAFSTGIGAVWPNNAFISFQPRLSFFTMYYLWDGKNALPAEVENRTALSLSFLIDLPAVASFRFGKNTFEAGVGLAVLARIGILPTGVKATDSGATGSASGDVDKINEWFWSSGRFLYPELIFNYDYCITERLRGGFEARFYIPLGSFISGRGMDATMMTIAARLVF